MRATAGRIVGWQELPVDLQSAAGYVQIESDQFRARGGSLNEVQIYTQQEDKP